MYLWHKLESSAGFQNFLIRIRFRIPSDTHDLVTSTLEVNRIMVTQFFIEELKTETRYRPNLKP